MSIITVHPDLMLERVLTLEIVRVTERAAVSAARLRGRGKDKASDQAAVDAMRRELNKLPIDGTVVIGEGEIDEAPMLFIGEKVGNKTGPKVDIAVDPLEGTTLCAKNMPGAIATIAMAEAGTLLHAPDCYMDKIAIGPGYPKGTIDLDAPPREHHPPGQGQRRQALGITADFSRPAPPCRHHRGGAQNGSGGEPDQRRRRGRRHPLRRAKDRYRHLSRHRRRAGRRAGGGGAALHRRANADAADHRHAGLARAYPEDGHQGPEEKIRD